MGHLLFTLRFTRLRQPINNRKKITLTESFNNCVPYEKKGPSGQLLWMQSCCILLRIWCPYTQWKSLRFIHMLVVEVGDGLISLVKDV